MLWASPAQPFSEMTENVYLCVDWDLRLCSVCILYEKERRRKEGEEGGEREREEGGGGETNGGEILYFSITPHSIVSMRVYED